MKKSKIILWLCSSILFFSSCNSKKATEPIDEKSTTLISNFFSSINEGNPNGAIRALLRNNENIDLKDSSTLQLLQKFDLINQSSGKYVDFRQLSKRVIGNSIALYTYLVRYKNKYYRFIFEFYDNGLETLIYKFKFDDSLDVEMEESLKLYLNQQVN